MGDEMTQGQAEPRELDSIIQDVWTTTHQVDPVQVIETICKRATKYASVEFLVGEFLGVDDLDPETLLHHVIGEMYADLITPEDSLIWGCGVTSEVAAALVKMREANSAQSEAEDALMEAIENDLNSAAQRVWDETHQTDDMAHWRT
jgi:hypothetical protein